MSAYLEVSGPDGRGRLTLLGPAVAIGRDARNDVILAEDHTVSRRHALIERLAAGWSVSDLGSTNGTFVNGEIVYDARPLYPGDVIQLGETRLVYRQEA